MPSFRPNNLSIPRSQAERLLEDLKTLLSRSPAFLVMLALVLVGMVGCSSNVEVETETSSTRPEAESEVLTAERMKTAVSVDFLRDQGAVLMEDGRLGEVPLDGVVVVEGCCLHFHEHLHLTLCEGDRKAERIADLILWELILGEGGLGEDV